MKLKADTPKKELLAKNIELSYLHLATSDLVESNKEGSLDILFSEISTMELTDSLRVEYAELFTAYKRYNYAYYTIAPRIDSLQRYRPLLTLYTKLLYEHFEESGNFEYLNWLLFLKDFYPAEEWCELFTGPCNISFQVLDNEKFREVFCETCQNRSYYAIRPDRWKN